MWAAGLLLGLLPALGHGLYDALNRIESARVYGNIDAYAYYFVDLLVGTPPQRVSVILDTGSGVMAFPCASCKHCGRHIDPSFDFARSSTAAWSPCGRECSGRCDKGHCTYYQGYTEGSSISGFWFKDYVRLGDAIQHNPPVLSRMGCHQNENNLFYTQKANGILGIGPSARGGGRTLLQEIFQDKAHVNPQIFSICLAEWGGRLTVGGFNASHHRGEVKYTSLSVSTGYYGISLQAMKVNGVQVATRFGRTMIDSGTTYTYMGSTAYRGLREAINSYCDRHDSCGAKRSKECWKLKESGSMGLAKFPNVEVVFSGATTLWVPKAYLYRNGMSNKWCFAFKDDGIRANTVLGASWMVHQEIIFDLRASRVGIVTASCPEYYKRPKHPADLSSEPSRPAPKEGKSFRTPNVANSTGSSVKGAKPSFSATAASTIRANASLAPNTSSPPKSSVVTASQPPTSSPGARPPTKPNTSTTLAPDPKVDVVNTTLASNPLTKMNTTVTLAPKPEDKIVSKTLAPKPLTKRNTTTPAPKPIIKAVNTTLAPKPPTQPNTTLTLAPRPIITIGNATLVPKPMINAVDTTLTPKPLTKPNTTILAPTPLTTPTSATLAPMPTTLAPMPTTPAPTPTTLAPKPTTPAPKPATTPVTSTQAPKPTTLAPKPATTPMTSTQAPKPTTEAPKPTTKRSTTTTSAPKPVVTTTAAPVATTAAPVVASATAAPAEAPEPATTTATTKAATQAEPDEAPTATIVTPAPLVSTAAPEQAAGPASSPAAVATAAPDQVAGPSGSPSKSEGANDFASWVQNDSLRIGAAGLGSLLLLGLCLRGACLLLRKREHRHVQLKDVDDSGMPPQIVGSAVEHEMIAGPETFVIGDDDDDECEALFEDPAFSFDFSRPAEPPSPRQRAESAAGQHPGSGAGGERSPQHASWQLGGDAGVGAPVFAGPAQASNGCGPLD